MIELNQKQERVRVGAFRYLAQKPVDIGFDLCFNDDSIVEVIESFENSYDILTEQELDELVLVLRDNWSDYFPDYLQ